jgi:hypothetical protein
MEGRAVRLVTAQEGACTGWGERGGWNVDGELAGREVDSPGANGEIND